MDFNFIFLIKEIQVAGGLAEESGNNWASVAWHPPHIWNIYANIRGCFSQIWIRNRKNYFISDVGYKSGLLFNSVESQ